MNSLMLHALTTTLLALSVHLLAGATLSCIVARPGARWRGGTDSERRCRIAMSKRSAISLARATPYAIGLLAIVLIARRVWPSSVTLGIEPVRLLLPGLFSLVGAGVTSGCCLSLHAARLEATGALRAARRLVRLGGRLMFLAAAVLLLLGFVTLLSLSSAQRDALLRGDVLASFALLLSALGIGVAAFVGLLAGLARKPRPSAYVAAAIYLAALFTLAAAAERGRQSIAQDAADRLAVMSQPFSSGRQE